MRSCDLCLDFALPVGIALETLAPCMGAMSSPRRLVGGLFGVGRCMLWRGVLRSLPAAPAPAPAPEPPACARAKVALPATNAAAKRVVMVFIGGSPPLG